MTWSSTGSASARCACSAAIAGSASRWIASARLRLIRRAVELGYNLDRHGVLLWGRISEQLIADALHPYPDDVVIATKGGMHRPIRGTSSIEHLEENVQAVA